MYIPDRAVPYILYQRTGYIKTRCIPGIARLPLKQLVALESFFRADAIKKAFTADVEKDGASIRAHLPSKLDVLLDIGCGIGGADVVLYHALRPKRMYLLDKDGVDSSIWYGFTKEGAAYNSFDLLRSLLISNGVPEDVFQLIDISHQPFPQIRFDLVISLLSWGFHYPVSTYLPVVYDSLTEVGVLIIDVRKDTDGEDQLRTAFSTVEVIQEKQKWRRLACRK